MDGRKRKQYDCSENSTKRGSPEKRANMGAEDSPVIKIFRDYQNELDTRHDKHERLVKCSRDMTIQSKRAIFQCHRISFNKVDTMSGDLDKIQQILKELPQQLRGDLAGEDPYLFIRAFSAGQQEFVEAVTLLHYLKDGILINYDQLCKDYFTFKSDGPEEQTLLLRPIDYMLGIADLTGELMRMCINCIGEGQHERATSICLFMRKIHNEFEIFQGDDKELSKKMRVLKQSLSKVENVSYTVHLRGTEVSQHMLTDLIKFAGMSFGGSAKPADDFEQ